MELEIACVNSTYTRQQLEELFTFASDMYVNTISVPTSLLTSFESFRDSVEYAALVGFPYGVAHHKVKEMETALAIESGATRIDFCLNNHFISAYDPFSIYTDFLSCQSLCRQNGIDFRVVIEYRLIEPKTLEKLSALLCKNDIEDIIMSTGVLCDDHTDTLIVCRQLSKDFNVSVTGSLFSEKYLNMLRVVGCHTVRCTTPLSSKNVLLNVAQACV